MSRILVIEDDRFLAEIVREELTRAGYTPTLTHAHAARPLVGAPASARGPRATVAIAYHPRGQQRWQRRRYGAPTAARVRGWAVTTGWSCPYAHHYYY